MLGGGGAAHGPTQVDGGTKTTFTHAAEVSRRDGSLDRLSCPILKTMFYDSEKSARNSRLKFNKLFDLVIEKYWEGFCSERLVVMSLLLLLLQHQNVRLEIADKCGGKSRVLCLLIKMVL